MATIHEIAKASSPNGTFVIYNSKRYQVAKINYVIDRIDLVDTNNELTENVHPSELSLAPEVTDVFVEEQVGTLTKPYGVKGYHTAQIGHPVFTEERGSYVVYLEPEQEGKPKNKVRFYKETLAPHIDFTNK